MNDEEALANARMIDLIAPAPEVTALILDFETNGRDAGNVPTQLAYQLVGPSGAVVESYSCFLRGATFLDAWVLENAPHITLDLCAAGEDLEGALSEMMAKLPPSALVVCHNAAFDLGLIEKHASEATNRALAAHEVFCTMKGSTDLCQIPSRYGRGYKWPRLQELADFLSVDRQDTTAHDAIGDVELTRRCLIGLVSRVPRLSTWLTL